MNKNSVHQSPKPKVPSMRLEKKRLASFTHIQWPFKNKLSPRNLAACGFFYDGLGDDFVRCFHCQVILGNWSEHSDPWVEHALKSENCFFLNCKKISRVPRPRPRTVRRRRAETITRPRDNTFSQPSASRPRDNTFSQPSTSRPRNVIFSQPSTSRPRDNAFSQSTSRPRDNAFSQSTSRPRDNTFSQSSAWDRPSTSQPWDNTFPTSSTAHFNYGPPTPEYSPPSPEHIDTDYSSTALFDYGPPTPEYSPPSPEHIDTDYSSTALFDYGPPTPEYSPQSPEYIDPDYSPTSPVRQFDSDDSNLEHPSTLFNPAPEPASPVDTSCKICLEKPMNIVLQPCRHLLMCDGCAYRVSECPICRQSIRERIEAILC